ncbi:MAG: hypothetical protein ACP5OE_09550 [Thermodesulfobium sp.]
MYGRIQFPKNPFEDILPSQFNKLNKKEVTEDFVAENFRILGWKVFKPFTDTGIDRIILKSICPHGHTKLDENLGNSKCNVCGMDSIEIIRFIQIKTRNLKDGIFGFTLKSKDIRADPRHIYVFYSDKTTEQKQDFLIISVKDLLSFFFENKINPFASTSFRKGNNKLNSLEYVSNDDKWYWGRVSWEKFRNIDGLKKIQSADMDLNLRKELQETRELTNVLLNKFSERGRSFSKNTVKMVNAALEEKVRKYQDKSNILRLRKCVSEFIENNVSVDVKESSQRYFDNVRLSETLGEGEQEDE